jgi:hypothetical protein
MNGPFKYARFSSNAAREKPLHAPKNYTRLKQPLNCLPANREDKLVFVEDKLDALLVVDDVEHEDEQKSFGRDYGGRDACA